MLPGEIKSLWTATTAETHYPALQSDISVDVAILGAGIAGLNAGYFLMRAGLRVAVIDYRRIATGTSGNTTAKITSQHSLKYDYLKKTFGMTGAKVYADSNQWAVAEFENIIRQENIDCDFVKLPAFVYSVTEEGKREIRQEVEVCRELGLPAGFIAKIENMPFPTSGAIKFDNQAYFHPRKYLLALAEIIRRRGGRIFEMTEVIDIKEGENNLLTTTNGNISAKYVIVSTNHPEYDKEGIFAQVYKARSYGLAIKTKRGRPEGMFIGIDGDKLSFRSHRSGKEEWMIVGGESHDVGKEEDTDHFARLEEKTIRNFNPDEVSFKWSAEDSMTHDRLPYIGKMPGKKNIFVTTGYAKWGMTTSLVSAKMLTDAIIGKKNEWEKLYDPARIKPGFFAKIKEKIFNKMNKRTTNAEISDFSDLDSDSGKIMSINGLNVAVYKDSDGMAHAYSAVCTHLGCTVSWNKEEKVWDCPCHGSRFGKDGNVIRGPAEKPLKRLELS